MTQEDKQIVAEYMEWIRTTEGFHYFSAIDKQWFLIHFDLNDAGLCVEKMDNTHKENDFKNFISIAILEWNKAKADRAFDAWLFNADNFFRAMAVWLRERGRNAR